jgi:hypothetical protein
MTTSCGSPRRRLPRAAAAGLFAALLALAGGCGGATGDVSGKVLYKGKPVVLGTVTFIGADGKQVQCTIQPDGSYSVAGVAIGEAKVLVDSPNPSAGGQPAAERGGGARPGRGGGRPGADPNAPTAPPGAPKVEREMPSGPAVSPEVAAQWVKIPDAYSSTTDTPLRFTVKKGSNTANIELSDK